MSVTTDQVRDKLRECYDPEIPCNILDLGLVYDVKVAGNRVEVVMTLTTPSCPLAQQITGKVRQKLLELPEISEVDVRLAFDPLWTPSMISEEGRRQLQMR